MAPDRPPGDFGSKLRAARERRGVSLRQIANATKISVGALEALERNDVSRLPGGIFSRAFVRSYAAEVGLDPDETIEEFLTQFQHDPAAAAQPPSAQVEDTEALESERRLASTFLRLMAFSIPLAVAIVYFGLSGRTASQRPAEPGAGAEPARPPASTAAEPTTTPVVAEPAARVPEPVQAKPPAVRAPSANPGAAPPAAAPDFKPRASGGVAAVSAAAPQPVDAVKPDEVSRLTVDLSVTRPCWLSATVDGEKKIERLLQAGERQTIEVGRELSLTAGDASAVKMTINGADAKPLGREGQVVTARVNRSNFRNYLPSR
jgi:cytoskeleton protein RodZ